MPAAVEIRLSIIIVNWNTRAFLLRCLESLRDIGELRDTEVIVVDNASHDGSADAVRTSFPAVRVIGNTANRGFAGGANDGFHASAGRFILLLNPDIILRPGQLDPLIQYLEDNQDVGAVTPLLVDDEGDIHYDYLQHIPKVMQVLLFSTEIRRWALKKRSLVERYLHFAVPSLQIPADIEQIAGAFILTSTVLLKKTRGFNESFRLFYEDVDWSVRVSSMGYRLVLYPLVKVTHFGGGSFTQDQEFWTAGRFSLSMIRYFRIHHGLSVAWLIAAILIMNALAVFAGRFVLRPFVGSKRRNTLDANARKQSGILRHIYRRYVLQKELELPS